MNIVWDSEKIARVPIDLVKPNPWNPKELGMPEWDRVRMSLDNIGLRLPIIVREQGDGYEILDGEQRWRASKALNSAEILILNLGVVSDKEAVEMTINFEQHVPPTQLKLADLLVSHMNKHPDFKLPYAEMDLDGYRKLREFNWGDASTRKEEVQEQMDGVQDFKNVALKFRLEDYAVIEQAHKQLKTKITVTLEEALKLICQMYLQKNWTLPNGEQG